MKANKLFGIIALIAIAFFGWAFMGCEDKDDSCNCPIKAHLAFNETCDCGKDSCNCTATKYASPNSGITIMRDKTVTDDQAKTALEVFKQAYNEIGDVDKTPFLTKVNTVHFVSGSGVPTFDKANKTLKVGINATKTEMKGGMLEAAYVE